MSGRFRSVLLLLLTVVCVTFALRHDLSQWQMARGERAFRRGDLRGALAAWSSAVIQQSARHLALLNRGVARYRLGELAAASADFRAAAASGDSPLRQRALYNLGTTLLVMDRELKTTDRQEAERLLTEAVRQLQAAADLNPTDAAAGHNRMLARARLAALAAGKPAGRPPQEPQEKRAQGAEASKQTGKAGTGAGKPGAATNRDGPTGQRRAAPALSPEQALRMLDDARGRESLRSGVAAETRQEKLTPPEKDW